MKKGLALFIASIIISSFVFADDIDDEIKKLEKETKLLELQKKKKDLELNKENPRSKANFKNPRLKNGIFIGIEGELGTNRLDFNRDVYDYLSNSIESHFFSASSTTFDLGLMGGYQYYFGQSQRHGIRASAHIYSGFGNSWDWKPQAIQTFNISYIPIKFGLDIKYLWDFLERGKHTLGLNAGLGWQFSWYVNGSFTNTYLDESFKEKLNLIFSHGFYPVLGLHYYYGHHQFEALYRFGGVLVEMGENSSIIDEYENGKTIARNYILQESYFTLNYAYRF